MSQFNKYVLAKSPKNKGILGQDILYVKNYNYLWALKLIKTDLWGRFSLDNGKNWSEWEVLLDDYNGFFSFTVSGKNKLHLICKNLEGNIIYGFWKEEKFTYEALDKNWFLEERIAYQTILVNDSGKVYIIFFTENPLEELWQIKFISNENNTWCEPEVIDYGLGLGNYQGAVALDNHDTIHLVYQTFMQGNYQFVYRNRYAKQKIWNEKILITKSKRINLQPSLIVDKKGVLHLTWIRSDGINYRVFYKKKLRGGWMVGGWSNDQYISPSGINAYSPALGIIDNRLIIFWQQIDGIYQCISDDEGQKFSQPKLEEHFQSLANINYIALDKYKEKGFNPLTAFDTGNTSLVLLATAFMSQDINRGNHSQILPSKNNNVLALDYGQKDLQLYLDKINGNIHKLVFEVEDTRLTNYQMKETINECEEKIYNFKKSLENKENKIHELEGKVRVYEKITENLKNILNEKVDIIRQRELAIKEEKLGNKKNTEEINKLYLEKNILKEKIKNLKIEKKDQAELLLAKELQIEELQKKVVELQKELDSKWKAPWKRVFM